LVEGENATASVAPREESRDLQPGPSPVLGAIPWGYGETRIRAMARDPSWIFAYWEFTDEALTRARAEVNDPDARTTLRICDTTYRLFDGTNANWSVDLPVDRGTRDYYVCVSRPASTFHVDIGVKSHAGHFATIARSGAVETPRDGISADTRVEWMTVEPDSGDRPEYRHHLVPRPGIASSLEGVGATGVPAGELERAAAALLGGEAWTGSEWTETEMGGRVVRWLRWSSPVRTERWWRERAGPFTRVEIRLGGEPRLVRVEHGARLVAGPWEVWIVGLDAWGERRTLDRWTVHYAWVTDEGTGRVDAPAILARVLGGYRSRAEPVGSEARLDRAAWGSEWLQRRASEWRWIGASEARLSGASEQVRLGASELHWLGASEQRILGASEGRLGGASEARIAEGSLSFGASEWLGGASPGGWPRPETDPR
jgi:hypothetical protein